jgi:hypothetical protein
MSPAAATVVVPVYDGAHTVAETLHHVASQRFTDFRVVVSIDRGTDESESVCRGFTGDRRFEVVAQPRRLGWVGNTNAAIRLVRTPAFCIVPHDDLLDPDYLGTVHDALSSDASIACAYTDLEGFGAQSPYVWQPGVSGDTPARALDVLLHHFPSVAFRGLVRRQHDTDFPVLPTGIDGDFAADTAWLMTLALRGALHRVPVTLYRKRYGSSSVHAGWSQWPAQVQRSRYLSLVATMTALALRGLDASVHCRIAAAGVLRATGLTRMEDDLGTPSGSIDRLSAARVFGCLLAEQVGRVAAHALGGVRAPLIGDLIDAEVGALPAAARGRALRTVRHARGNLLARLAARGARIPTAANG